MKTLVKAAVLVASSLSSALAIAANADSIYFGGTIITVNDKAPSAEAVAVKGGKIVAVGSRKAVFASEKGKSTALHDLKGQVLVPGFVDGHSHFSEVGLQTVSANLLSPPDGPVKNYSRVAAGNA